MLFFNFLCLFYLMVLINGFTISKSNLDDDTPDSFDDSLWEPGSAPRTHHARRGRRGHGTPVAITESKPAGSITEVSTTTARVKNSFWKIFHPNNKTFKKSKHYNSRQNGSHSNNNGKKRRNQNQKREISTEFGFNNKFFKSTKDFFANTSNNQIKFFNITNTDPTSTLDNVTSVTNSLTTSKSTQSKATTLSTLQSILNSKKYSTDLKTSSQTTTAECYGTMQIEALLNKIKAREMQMLVENNPAVTSLITNSVNEVTFESDTILNHIDQITPYPKAASILKTSNTHKRTTQTFNANDTAHNILRRSPFETISTMANSMEDALQNELKKVYKKLKCKVGSHYKLNITPPIAHHKTTHTSKATSRATYAHTTHHTTSIKPLKRKEKISALKTHHHVAKAIRGLGKKKKITTTSTTTEASILSNFDNSKLLGVLEQMLVKTSEYNVMQMATMPSLTPISQIEKLSKRNVETLADLKLKEQVEGNEHGELMPVLLHEVDSNMEDEETTSFAPDQGVGTINTEAISLASISDKISYNDYVNGYKYYLKYQQEQEQDDEKFSPMIRYQAHKHHKVDDIGKYILGKLPQIRFARNIFEEIDMDDQDISTKSDDSWFKKHFYMFLDSNTPKKFHTSETVSLKSALTEASMQAGKLSGQSMLPPLAEQNQVLDEDKSAMNFGQLAKHLGSETESLKSTLAEPSVESDKPSQQSMRPLMAKKSQALDEEKSAMHFDQLADHLESYKAEFSASTMSTSGIKLFNEEDEPVENGFILKMMDLLLGMKDRRALKKTTPKTYDQPEARFRRHTKKSKHKEKESHEITQKIIVSEPGVPGQKDKFSKLGIVQMIAQPTTVVKMPSKKKSKFKNLVDKFHLRKKKKNKRTKRQALRKQRNPFEKIKEIFLGSKHNKHGTSKSNEVNDFDIMTTEIDTFKAVKFNRVPSVDEIRKQIPDINEDLAEAGYTTKSAANTSSGVNLYSRTRPFSSVLDSNDAPLEFHADRSQVETKVTSDMRQMTMKQLEHYLADSKKSLKGPSEQSDSASRSPEVLDKTAAQTLINENNNKEENFNLADIEGQNKMYDYSSMKLAKNEGPLEMDDNPAPEMNVENDAPSQMSLEIMDVEGQNRINEDDSMKLDKNEGPLEIDENSAPEMNADNDAPTQKSMVVIRKEIDKLKKKLTMYDSLEKTTAQDSRPESNDAITITKVMFVPSRIHKFEKGTEINKKDEERARDSQTLKTKREVIDLESVIEWPKLYKKSGEAANRPIKKYSITFNPITIVSSHITEKSNLTHTIEDYKTKKILSHYSVDPDHFADLLLWHGDILDIDLLTTTPYLPGVDNDFEDRYTTPNVALLANEVQNMKHFISKLQPVDYVKKASSTTGKCRTNSRPATTIMRDGFSAGENGVVVLGKAQYLSFSKEENLDYGSEPIKAEKIKSHAEKKTKGISIAQPVYSQQISARSNWTNLAPRPNVVYNASPHSRDVTRRWRNPTRALEVPSAELFTSAKPLMPTYKSHQAPEQYFSTPLPMDSQNFENFLKKSHLDVDSVTAPLSDAEVNMSSQKLRTSNTINDPNALPSVKTTPDAGNLAANALHMVSEKQYLMNALNQLQLGLKNVSQIAGDRYLEFSDDVRFRRHSSEFERISDAYTKPYKVFRRRIFCKKTSKSPEFGLSKDSDASIPRKENIEENEGEYNTKDLSKYRLKTPQNVNVQMAKFNNLLYFCIPGKSKNLTTSTKLESILGKSEKVTVELPKKPKEKLKLTTLFPNLTGNPDLSHNNKPKTVHISYHYNELDENRPKILKARHRAPFTKEVSDKSLKYNSEVEELTNRPMALKGISTWAVKMFDLSKEPFQTKSRLSKVKRNHIKKKYKRDAKTITENPILSKRNANPATFTAQNVAAFEIYLDLTKSTPAGNVAGASEMNALQVHIALPNKQQDMMKRQLNPSKPVFSAKMSNAVNLEYQVPVLDERFTTESHSLSPGLYMLVDNVVKSGNVTLKPILFDLSVLKPRQIVPVKLTTESTSPECATTNNINELKKVTLNKGFIAAVNKHLVQLYENFSSLNSADKNVKSNESVSDVKGNDVANRTRRDIWPALKEMLGGERTCSCHFKENQTLCPTCVATDAVIGEIIFEFNNLANYMREHCTEIQTFFWMNPTGGKKLTDSVHRLDRMLNDYYKRVKGKCQGKTCQALASRLDKRTIRNRRRIFNEFDLTPGDVHNIANDLANMLKHSLPYSKNLEEKGEEFLNVVENCLPGLRYKKYVTYKKDKSLSDVENNYDRIHRHGQVKNRNIKSNYKREATQIEKPLNADAGGSFWSDYINKFSTKPQFVEQEPVLMTETTLNALTHNINELFQLFNNLNLTEIDSINILEEKEHHDNTEHKKANKKKIPKKLKKKHKFRLLKKKNKKIIKNKPTTSTQASGIYFLPTEKLPTTCALQVILSNIQQRPSLHVKVDTIAANVSHTTVTTTANKQTTQATVTHKLLGTGISKVMPTDKAITYEEGYGVRNNFLHKLKHLFNGKNNISTPRYNLYRKRSARTSADGSKNSKVILNISISTPANTMTVTSNQLGDTNKKITSTERISDSTSEPTCTTVAAKYPTEEAKCSSAEEPKRPTTEPYEYREPTSPPQMFTETTEYSTISPQETNESTQCLTTPKESPLIEYDSHHNEDVISGITEQTYPTIIIFDEASTDTSTDEVTIEIIRTSNEETKDLLLSVLAFEKQKLDEEIQKVRGSREIDAAIQATDRLAEELFLTNQVSFKSSNKHPLSFATGNYSMMSDLLHTIRKGYKQSAKVFTQGSTKSSTESTTKAFATFDSFDAHNNWRTSEKEADKFHSQLSSTTGRATPTSTQTMPSTPHVQTTSAQRPYTSPEVTVTSIRSQLRKASDARLVPRVCDLSATIDHVLELQGQLTPTGFEEIAKNLTCFKFRETPECFLLNKDKMWKSKKSKNQGSNNLKLKRNQKKVIDKESKTDDKISVEPKLIVKSNNCKKNNFGPVIGNIQVNFVADDDFEKYYKGEHGIYKMVNSKRKKRKAYATNLTAELTDLPPIRSTTNEILAMSGDPLTLHFTPVKQTGPPDKGLRWTAEPEALLRRPNVKMDGDDVYIDGVQESNAGSYVCKQGDVERSRVLVRVLAVPEFQVMFTPVYSIQNESCGHNDLRAIRSLARAMSDLVCPKGHCSVAVNEPDCLKDKSDGSSLLRASTSLTVSAPRVTCSATCRRDLAAQLTKMAVEDVLTLTSINVLIAGKRNKRLVPFTGSHGEFAVTRRLRRKGFSRERKHDHLPPGSVDVMLKCPRRYQLRPAFKICVADPLNPSDKVRRGEQASRWRRRYEWWWYPPCGYVAALVGAAVGCAACGACGACGALARRERPGGGCAEAARQPASPSRVILARLFKRSLSAFRNTDSQETRSNKATPPPLPPIDFD